MNYQPFFGMNILVSYDLLQSLTLIFNVFIVLILFFVFVISLSVFKR